MVSTALFCFLFPFAAAHGQDFNKTVVPHYLHKLNENQSSWLKFNYAVEANDKFPTIYIIGDHDGGMTDDFMPIDLPEKWISEPKNAATREAIEQKISEEQNIHPHKIVFEEKTGSEGARLFLELLRTAPHSYELQYENKGKYNTFVSRTLHMKDGLVEYQEVLKTIPANQVTFIDKSTGESHNLQDFVSGLVLAQAKVKAARAPASVPAPLDTEVKEIPAFP